MWVCAQTLDTVVVMHHKEKVATFGMVTDALRKGDFTELKHFVTMVSSWCV